jgi:two-component system, NtrC family, response regulator GlrR
MESTTVNPRLRDRQAFCQLIGEAPSFLKAILQLPATAQSDATVLISGETGTGKELVAQTIHYLSNRTEFPFLAVNCGSLTPTLQEEELFGHERGAFTDGRDRRAGLVAQADKGTLFLDEVDTLTDKGQVTLLRVLQDRTFRPLGSTREQHADVRFLASTNAPLWSLVQAGSFRADLYYRLSVFAINLPALRDRKEDILALAGHFLRKYARPERPAFALSPRAQAALLAYDWPGNVRELENTMNRATWLSPTESIEVENLGLTGTAMRPVAPDAVASTRARFAVLKKLAINAFEREYLVRIMAEHQGNVTHAAHLAGIDRRDLGRLLKKHQLDPRSFTASTVPTSTSNNPPSAGENFPH